MWICIELSHNQLTSNVLRYDVLYKGLHSFTYHQTRANSHTCLYFPAAQHHCPLVGTHCTYPRKDGQAELWSVGPRQYHTMRWTPIRSVLTGPGIEQLCWSDQHHYQQRQTTAATVYTVFEFKTLSLFRHLKMIHRSFIQMTPKALNCITSAMIMYYIQT